MPQQPDERRFTPLGLRPTGDLGALTYWTTKRGRVVAILKAPPLNPPSIMQQHMRDQYRLIATQWRALHPNTRAAWLRAAKKARLYVTGYNLFVWYQRTHDRAAIQTIERQTKETLLDGT